MIFFENLGRFGEGLARARRRPSAPRPSAAVVLCDPGPPSQDTRRNSPGRSADVGGPLSHSPIVAREYGIPAVLGTGVATQRLNSGQQIRVDGDAGTVTIEHPTPT
jgi:phosphoenolpyruvate-protein kinase (PTS system EI component)